MTELLNNYYEWIFGDAWFLCATLVGVWYFILACVTGYKFYNAEDIFENTMEHPFEILSGLLVGVVGGLVIYGSLSLLPIIVPVAIVGAVLYPGHKRNKAVKQAQAELSGENG